MRFATLQVAMSLVFAFSTDSTPLLVLGGAAGLTGIAMGMWTVPGNSASRGCFSPAKSRCLLRPRLPRHRRVDDCSISSHRFRAMIATKAAAIPATSRPLTCSPQASLPIKARSTRLDAEKSVNARADWPSKPPASARSKK